VAVVAVAHWVIVTRLKEDAPLVLFAAAAAALTFWRGLGPGMLASSLGTAVGTRISFPQFAGTAGYSEHVSVEALLLFGGSMFTCWLIYRLRAQQEDAEAVRVRRNEALAFVSHELRQPLSNIKLAASLLERDLSESNRTRATRLIGRSASRLGKVIDDLADVTRLQSSSVTVDRTLVRLQKPMLAAVEEARPEIDRRQQILEVDVPPDPPLWMHGDAVRLQQVFGNLLSNASKYSPEGAEISLSARKEMGRAVVVVRDTGLGIRSEMLEPIFGLFVRENDHAEGLGIGLTLARDLVTLHAGRITAQSDGPGRGSAFVVELPLVAGEIPSFDLEAHEVS
jgi:signal transduction histidine kinase